jgi:hypothetical protein
MNNLVKCPTCGTEFDNSEAVEAEIIERVRAESAKELSAAKAELERKQILAEEAKVLFEAKQLTAQSEIETKANQLVEQKTQQIKKGLEESNKDVIKSLQSQIEEKSSQITKLSSVEIENQQIKNQLSEKENEYNLRLEKEKGKIIEEQRAKILDTAKEIAKNDNLELMLSLQEAQIKNDQLTKKIDELSQNANQGSVQIQGEAQEILIENLLREWYPRDTIKEIKKGQKGADCLQIVFNDRGEDCGRILYESKRTKHWQNDWIKKIIDDSAKEDITVRVIITNALPQDMPRGGTMDGVWIASFDDFKMLTIMLRGHVVKLYDNLTKEENKSDKMVRLYDYFHSPKFQNIADSIITGFRESKQGLDKEKQTMIKLWAERERKMEGALISMYQMVGDINGIAGEVFKDELPEQSSSKKQLK